MREIAGLHLMIKEAGIKPDELPVPVANAEETGALAELLDMEFINASATDLANPVSNSIYQRIGYRPVEDRVVLAFSAD